MPPSAVLWAQALVGDAVHRAALDSYASFNAITETAVPTSTRVRPSAETVRWGQGTGVPQGCVTLDVQIGTKRARLDLLVFSDLPVDVILSWHAVLTSFDLAVGPGGAITVAGMPLKEAQDPVRAAALVGPTTAGVTPAERAILDAVEELATEGHVAAVTPAGQTASSADPLGKAEQSDHMSPRAAPKPETPVPVKAQPSDHMLSPAVPTTTTFPLEDLSELEDTTGTAYDNETYAPPLIQDPPTEADVEEVMERLVQLVAESECPASLQEEYLSGLQQRKLAFLYQPDVPNKKLRTCMRLNTGDAVPKMDPIIRHRGAKRDFLIGVKDKLLKAGLIEKFLEPTTWRSNAVAARNPPKKKEPFRECIFPAALNQATIPSGAPPDDTELVMQRVLRADVFSLFDISKAFWCCAVHPDDQQKTATVFPEDDFRDGLYVWKAMAFGFSEASPTYYRWMAELLSNLDDVGNIVDNCAVTTVRQEGEPTEAMWRRHFQTTFALLDRAIEYHVRFKLDSDVELAVKSRPVKFMGHIFEGERMKRNPETTSAIMEYTRPTTLKGLLRFNGLINYPRRFVPNFSRVTAPLTDMTKPPQHIKDDNNHRREMGRPRRTDWKLEWTEEGILAFERIKRALATSLHNTYPLSGPEWRFVVGTDWSPTAIGWMFEQINVRTKERRLLNLGSRKLKGAEKNLGAPAGELLGVVEGNRVFDEQYGTEGAFRIIENDQKSLEYTTKQVDMKNSRVKRHVIYVSQLNHEWTHRPGKEMVGPDAMSRHYLDAEHPVGLVLTNDVAQPEREESEPQKAQRLCPETIALRFFLKTGKWPAAWAASKTPQARLLRSVAPRLATEFVEKDGLLFRLVEGPNNTVQRLFYVPVVQRRNLLQHRHDSELGGHQGGSALANTLKQEGATWIGMDIDAQRYVDACDHCDVSKGRFKAHGDLTDTAHYRSNLHVIQMDIVGPLPTTDEGSKYILSIFNSNTGNMVALPLKSRHARSVARAYVEGYVCNPDVNSLPQVIQMDNSKEFRSNLLRNVNELLGTKVVHSNTYAPWVQGGVERMHQDLERYLRIFVASDQRNWDVLLPYAQFAFNTTWQQGRGASPAFLHTGNLANFPSDFAAITDEFLGVDTHRLDNALNNAKATLEKTRKRSQLYYASKHLPHTFSKGDIVRVRKHRVAKRLQRHWLHQITAAPRQRPPGQIKR